MRNGIYAVGRAALPPPGPPMNPRYSRRNGFHREELPSDHPVTRLFDEHSQLLASIDRLEGLTASCVNDPTDPGDRMVLEEIRDLAARLVHSGSHEVREEHLLLPMLEGGGCTPALLEEHERLRCLSHGLWVGVGHLIEGAGKRWSEVRGVARDLIATLRLHIEREERELYPAALEAARDEGVDREWFTDPSRYLLERVER